VLAAVLNLGYTVSDGGTVHYQPSRASGTAIPLALRLAGFSHRTSAGTRRLSRVALKRRLRQLGRNRIERELHALRIRRR